MPESPDSGAPCWAASTRTTPAPCWTWTTRTRRRRRWTTSPTYRWRPWISGRQCAAWPGPSGHPGVGPVRGAAAELAPHPGDSGRRSRVPVRRHRPAVPGGGPPAPRDGDLRQQHLRRRPEGAVLPLPAGCPPAMPSRDTGNQPGQAGPGPRPAPAVRDRPGHRDRRPGQDRRPPPLRQRIRQASVPSPRRPGRAQSCRIRRPTGNG